MKPALPRLFLAALVSGGAWGAGPAVNNQSDKDWTLKLVEPLKAGKIEVFENEFPGSKVVPKYTLQTKPGGGYLLKAKSFYVFQCGGVKPEAVVLLVCDPSGNRQLTLKGLIASGKPTEFSKFIPVKYEQRPQDRGDWTEVALEGKPCPAAIDKVVEPRNLANGTIVIMAGAFGNL